MIHIATTYKYSSKIKALNWSKFDENDEPIEDKKVKSMPREKRRLLQSAFTRMRNYGLKVVMDENGNVNFKGKNWMDVCFSEEDRLRNHGISFDTGSDLSSRDWYLDYVSIRKKNVKR